MSGVSVPKSSVAVDTSRGRWCPRPCRWSCRPGRPGWSIADVGADGELGRRVVVGLREVEDLLARRGDGHRAHAEVPAIGPAARRDEREVRRLEGDVHAKAPGDLRPDVDVEALVAAVDVQERLRRVGRVGGHADDAGLQDAGQLPVGRDGRAGVLRGGRCRETECEQCCCADGDGSPVGAHRTNAPSSCVSVGRIGIPRVATACDLSSTPPGHAEVTVDDRLRTTAVRDRYARSSLGSAAGSLPPACRSIYTGPHGRRGLADERIGLLRLRGLRPALR